MALDISEMLAIDAMRFQRMAADRAENAAQGAALYSETLRLSHLASANMRDAHAARTISEAGSGRTRAETNAPAATSAGQGNGQ